MTFKDLQTESIRKGCIKDLIPELYDLIPIIEIGPWHDHQSAFDHTLAVYDSLNVILDAFKDNEPRAFSYLNRHLQSYIGTKERIELLSLVILLHDIGKVHSLTTLANGNTSNPSHEFISASMSIEICNRFQLSEQEKSYVLNMILHHGYVSQTIVFAIEKGNIDPYFRVFNALVKDLTPDLLLFMMADLYGSDLRKFDVEKFNAFEVTIKKMLNEYFELQLYLHS